MDDRSRFPRLPLALDVAGRLVVVVGAGSIAERRVRTVLESGAAVRMIAPRASGALRTLAAEGRIDHAARAFAASDLDGAILAIAATDDDAVNEAVVLAGRARGVLVCDASDVDRGDVALPVVHRTGRVTFAIDTDASAPAFAVRLRDELRARYGERYGRAAATLAVMRSYALATLPAERRAPVLRALAARDVDLLAARTPSQAQHDVDDAVDELAEGPPQSPAVKRTLRCATRGSALALWQSRHVAASLARGGYASELIVVSTRGDVVTDRPLAAIGANGVFVKELETALREERADYAVHSCKDLPSTAPPDMRMAAFLARDDPRDAFCSEKYASLEALPAGAVVGTSSPRRTAQLRAVRPDLAFVDVRGNVDTRLRKLRDGACDALVLAAAGLARLGIGATHVVPFSVDVMVPAVAQGTLALECRAEDDALAAVLATLDDPVTSLCSRTERAFLRAMNATCDSPIGAYATCIAGELRIRTFVAAAGGAVARDDARAEIGGIEDAEAFATALAAPHVARGGLDGALLLLPRTQDRPSRIAEALRRERARVLEVASSEDAARELDGRVPDALLFPSSGSVDAIASYLAKLAGGGRRPLIATMGEASSAAARAHGFAPDVTASEPTVPAFVHAVAERLMRGRLVP